METPQGIQIQSKMDLLLLLLLLVLLLLLNQVNDPRMTGEATINSQSESSKDNLQLFLPPSHRNLTVGGSRHRLQLTL